MSFLLLKLIGLVIPLRAADADETVGLDLSQHGEEAYAYGGASGAAHTSGTSSGGVAGLVLGEQRQ